MERVECLSELSWYYVAAAEVSSGSFSFRLRRVLAGQGKHHFCDKVVEGLVLGELFVDLRIVLEQREHDFGKRLVVLDASGVGGVLLRVLISRIGRNVGCNFFFDTAR